MLNQDYSVGWVIAESWPYRNVMASTRIRCFDIIDYLKNNGVKTGIYSSFKKYDIVVFQKTFNENNYRTARKLKSQGTRIILDINVNYFEKTGETRQVTEDQIKDLHKFMDLADVVLVSSQYLKEVAGKYHHTVYYIPEHISTVGSFSPGVISNPVKLLYCGYAIKADSILLIADVLNELKKVHDIEFLFICERDPGLKLPIKSYFIKFKYKDLANILRKGDMKITPRKLDNSYDMGHSFTKIGYPMSVGLPVVASPVPSYKDSPALLAASPEDWMYNISLLINNPGEYRNLSQQGITYVKKNYSIEKIGHMYLELIKDKMHE